MMSRRAVSRAHTLLLSAALGLMVMFGFLTWDRNQSAASARGWVQDSFTVIGTIRDLDGTVRQIEASARAYLLTGSPDDLADYGAAQRDLSALRSTLSACVSDQQDQQARLLAIEPAFTNWLDQMALVVSARRDTGLEAARALLADGNGRRALRAIETALGAMTKDEQALLTTRLAMAASRAAWVGWMVWAGTSLGCVSLIIGARLLNQAWIRSSDAETEQRLLAERLRTSLDSLSQGVAVFGPRRTLRHWNAAFEALLDVPAALLQQDTPYAALADHCRLEDEEEIQATQHPVGEPVVYECKAGPSQQLEIRRTPVPGGGFVLTVTDMTRRAEAEAVLRDAQKMRAIGQLTGGIAHDFNNLLTVIMGNLEIVASGLPPADPLRVYVSEASWAAHRGGTLATQLLTFARKRPLDVAPVDLAATLPALIPMLRRTLGEHIDVQFSDGTGLWHAMTDPAQLESAVLNLALNARDAMPEGGRLSIELQNITLDAAFAAAHADVAADDYVTIAVTDTGHGMTKEILARAFEPFFTTKGEGYGTGMGLAMVFGFVRQSGGHIGIRSAPGEGTTVRLYLPRAKVPAGTQRAAAAAEGGAPVSATILIVEDEASVRDIAVTMARDLGYRVLQAADGEEGLRVFSANAASIDLLLTDVLLPGRIRGPELAKRVMAMRPDLRVLFMSGYAENEIVHEGRLDEGARLLSKPFKQDRLAKMLAEALAGTQVAVATG